MEAIRTEGSPWSTLVKATVPTSAASEQDSGFSDTSSEHHSLAESRDGGVRHGLGSIGDGPGAGARAHPQMVAQSPSTFAQPGLHSFYILKNVFINQPLCMTSADPQVMHAQLKTWGGDHSQILLVPGPPLAAPHEQRQQQQPQPQSAPPPPPFPQPQAKTSGYLPIFNSYQRIAPRPGKAERAPPEATMPPPPPSPPPLLPSVSPPPPLPPLPLSVGDVGAWRGKRPQLASGRAARESAASVAGPASTTPHLHQQQQRRKKRASAVPTHESPHLASHSKHQHAAQHKQHQRQHKHGHGRGRHRHRHAKRASHRDRAPLSQQFTTLVSLLNSVEPSIPIAPPAEPQEPAFDPPGAASAPAPAVAAFPPPPGGAVPPNSPVSLRPCPPAPCGADDPLPAAPAPFTAPSVPVLPMLPLCDDELQTMDFLDEVLPLVPEAVGAPAGSHAHGGGEEWSRAANGLLDGGGGGHEQRFNNTVSILSRSGLLDITMRTKDLLRRNGQTQRELERLRRVARLFCRAARSREPSAWDGLQEAMGALDGGHETAATSLSSSSSSSASLSSLSSSSTVAEVGASGSEDAGFVGCDDDGGGGGGGGHVGDACLPWPALTDAVWQTGLGVVTSWAA